MGLDDFIQTAMNNVLKNPILSVLRDINFSSILKQSNFIKRDIGVKPYMIILHFLYMFIINRKISSFMKYSTDSFKKHVYYMLQKTTDVKVLIIDDTIEVKRGKYIQGSCRNLWNNKEHTYKKRWNIEQGYKDLREYFQFGKEENRIFEALVARITLSFFAYNLTSYINRINNEPQTLGELFRDLECQLETLAISMELFLKILEQLVQVQEIVKRNKDLEQIILMLRVYTKKQLGFMCES